MRRLPVLAPALGAAALFALPWIPVAAGSPAAPVQIAAASEAQAVQAPVLRLHEALIAAMKAAKTTPFAERERALGAVILDSFNLPAMTEIAAGPYWNRMNEQERKSLIEAFSKFSVATYTARFNEYDGDRFEITGQKPGPDGSVWVLTRLIVAGTPPIVLNYLLRQYDGAWRIVDVYLKGSISEMANRRSEFTSTLRREGVAGLLRALSQGTARMQNEPA